MFDVIDDDGHPVIVMELVEAPNLSELVGERGPVAPASKCSSYRAAIWEFTYSSGGADLRVANLGFITPRYGFALYFQTRAGDWDRLQPVLQAFKDSFKAPA